MEAMLRAFREWKKDSDVQVQETIIQETGETKISRFFLFFLFFSLLLSFCLGGGEDYSGDTMRKTTRHVSFGSGVWRRLFRRHQEKNNSTCFLWEWGVETIIQETPGEKQLDMFPLGVGCGDDYSGDTRRKTTRHVSFGSGVWRRLFRRHQEKNNSTCFLWEWGVETIIQETQGEKQLDMFPLGVGCGDDYSGDTRRKTTRHVSFGSGVWRRLFRRHQEKNNSTCFLWEWGVETIIQETPGEKQLDMFPLGVGCGDDYSGDTRRKTTRHVSFGSGVWRRLFRRHQEKNNSTCFLWEWGVETIIQETPGEKQLDMFPLGVGCGDDYSGDTRRKTTRHVSFGSGVWRRLFRRHQEKNNSTCFLWEWGVETIIQETPGEKQLDMFPLGVGCGDDYSGDTRRKTTRHVSFGSGVWRRLFRRHQEKNNSTCFLWEWGVETIIQETPGEKQLDMFPLGVGCGDDYSGDTRRKTTRHVSFGSGVWRRLFRRHQEKNNSTCFLWEWGVETIIQETPGEKQLDMFPLGVGCGDDYSGDTRRKTTRHVSFGSGVWRRLFRRHQEKNNSTCFLWEWGVETIIQETPGEKQLDMFPLGVGCGDDYSGDTRRKTTRHVSFGSGVWRRLFRRHQEKNNSTCFLWEWGVETIIQETPGEKQLDMFPLGVGCGDDYSGDTRRKTTRHVSFGSGVWRRLFRRHQEKNNSTCFLWEWGVETIIQETPGEKQLDMFPLFLFFLWGGGVGCGDDYSGDTRRDKNSRPFFFFLGGGGRSGVWRRLFRRHQEKNNSFFFVFFFLLLFFLGGGVGCGDDYSGDTGENKLAVVSYVFSIFFFLVF